LNDAAPDPAFRAGRIDDKVQPVAVGVPARALLGADADSGQAVVGMTAMGLVSVPHCVPHSIVNVMGFQ
jgi:hypothetical protein